MSIAYNNNLWTMNAMMFIKYKLCKTFNFDRIIPKKDYIQGNLVIVSDIVNRVKSDASLKDMEKILTFYTNKINKINNL